MLTVIATIKAKAGQEATVQAELQKLVAPTHQEEGCIDYVLHQDNEAPSTFVFYENWESEALLEQHLASTHIAACFGALDGVTESIEVQKLSKV